MEKIKSKFNPDICYHMIENRVTFHLDGKYIKIRYTQIPIEAKKYGEEMERELMGIYDLVYPLRKCVICGSLFHQINRRIETCSLRCKKERTRERNRVLRSMNQKPKTSTLDKKITEAARLGISYGKWQQMQTLKELDSRKD